MNNNKIFVYFADMVTMDIDVYDVLKVGDKHMDVSDLKQICQKQIKLLHPDKNGGQESEEFLKVMKVWTILNDDKSYSEAKAKSLAKKKANWDTLAVTDMDYNGKDQCYFKDCRCGDQYLLPEDELCEDTEEYCIECDSCSNTITVKLTFNKTKS